MRKRLIQSIPWLALVGIIIAAAICFGSEQAVLELENKTAHPIRDMHVVVWAYQFDLGDLSPGEKKRIKIKNYSDSSWKVEGIWSSGERFAGDYGYITHGMSCSDKLIFGPNQHISFISNP